MSDTFQSVKEQQITTQKKYFFENPQIVETPLNLKFQTRYQVHPSGVSGGRLEEGWTGEQGHTSGCCFGARAENMSLPCAEWDSMSCSASASLKRWEHVEGKKKNQGLALFNRVPLLWGNSPWGR